MFATKLVISMEYVGINAIYERIVSIKKYKNCEYERNFCFPR